MIDSQEKGTEMKRWMLVVPMCVALLGVANEAAAVPDTTHFTARVSDGDGPITGVVPMTFKFFDTASTGTGTELWSEDYAALIATEGLVTVELGQTASNGLDSIVFDGSDVWLEVTVNSVVQSPRIKVGVVPYAVAAGTAETLGDLAPGDVQQLVTGTCAAGSSIRAIAANGTVTCEPDDVGTGDITGVTASTGLTGGGTSGTVSLSVDTSTIQARVASSCAAGSAIRAIAAGGTVTCEGGATGDITGVTASTGLSGGGTSGTVSLSVDTSVIQARVSNSCAAGSSIRAIAANGTVTCEPDTVGTGDITGVTASTGLSGGGTSGTVALSVDTAVIQARVSSSCNVNSSIRAIAANGTVTCEADSNSGGDITGVTASTGLSGGGSSGTVSLSVSFSGSGSASTVARSDHGHTHNPRQAAFAFIVFESDPASSAVRAHGYVNSNGTNPGGGYNYGGVSWNAGLNRYEIAITGESYFYNNYATVITPTTAGVSCSTGSVSGELLVTCWDY